MSSSSLSTEFNRKVDANAARLVESYRILLKKAQVGSSVEPQDELVLSTSASNIALHTHELLDQVNELRLQFVLHQDDFAEKLGDDAVVADNR